MTTTKTAPKIYVSEGSHGIDRPGDNGEAQGRCIMEWASWLYQQQHSDATIGVHETIRTFCIQVNDSVRPDLRQLMIPYLARMVGTAALPDYVFAWKALNFIAKEWTPIWLEKAGYTEEATLLRDLPELTSESTDEEIKVVEDALDRAYEVAPEDKRAEYGDEEWDGTGTSEPVRSATMCIEGSCAVKGKAGRVIATMDEIVKCAYAHDEIAETERRVEEAAIGLLDKMLPAEPIEKPKRRGWKKMLGLAA